MPYQQPMETELHMQPKFRNEGERKRARTGNGLAKHSSQMNSGCGGFAGPFRDLTLQLARLERQLLVGGLGKPIVQAAHMLD